NFLHLATGATLLAATGRAAWAEAVRPLADRLADYADRISFSDLDVATVERIKSHVIDTLGCGIGALDEPPVRICRDVASMSAGGSSTLIGAGKRSTPDLAAFPTGATSRSSHPAHNLFSPSALCGQPLDNIAHYDAVVVT